MRGSTEEEVSRYLDTVQSRLSSFLSERRHTDAIAMLDAEIANSTSKPSWSRAHLASLAGSLLLGLSDPTGSLDRYRRAMELDSADPNHVLGAARALLDLGKPAEAISLCRQAASLARQDSFWSYAEPFAIGLEGVCLVNMGQTSEALPILDELEGRCLDDQSPSTWCDLQLVHALLERDIEIERCHAYLLQISLHATQTADSDLRWRVDSLLDKG